MQFLPVIFSNMEKLQQTVACQLRLQYTHREVIVAVSQRREQAWIEVCAILDELAC